LSCIRKRGSKSLIFIHKYFCRIKVLKQAGQLTLCLTKPIVDEYVDVLKRLGLQNERELDELLGLFAQGFYVLFSAETPDLFVVKEDPADNKFIECAVALKAACVISGDKHLTVIRDYMGIKVVSPKEFLDIYTEFKR